MCDTVSSSDKLLKLVNLFYRGCLGFTSNDIPPMSWNIQEQFLNMTVTSTRLKKYPVNKKFTRLFLKKLLYNIDDSQVHDDFYCFLCSVMSDDTTEDKFTHRHYVIDKDLNNVVTIRETNNMVVNGTTGLRTWEAALMLTDWALSNSSLFKRKKILELGSGVGLTGITVAKLCEVQSMYLTDHHNEVLQNLKENIRINFVQFSDRQDHQVTIFHEEAKSIEVMLLDWNFIENFCGIIPDIIIGADIVYDPDILQPLCNVFKTFFDRNKSLEIYIESVIRCEETFEKFTEVLEVMLLDWNFIENFCGIIPDIIIGADIVYDPDILQPLCNVFKTFFDRNKSLEIYIESVIRCEETFEKFTEVLGTMNFKFNSVQQDTSVHLDWDCTVPRMLLKITC